MEQTADNRTILQIPGKLKLLDIGSGPGDSVASVTFPEAEITRLDVDASLDPDIVHDLTQPFPEELHGQFDVVFASHVLEHLYRMSILPAVRNIYELLRDGGEFWAIVPSLEWAAYQVLQDRPHPGWYGVMYGGQHENGEYSMHQVHKHGFRLVDLRNLLQLGGFVVRQAFQNEFTLSINDGNGAEDTLFRVPQNVAIGLKHNGTDLR